LGLPLPRVLEGGNRRGSGRVGHPRDCARDPFGKLRAGGCGQDDNGVGERDVVFANLFLA
jgi:hypothetical protein